MVHFPACHVWWNWRVNLHGFMDHLDACPASNCSWTLSRPHNSSCSLFRKASGLPGPPQCVWITIHIFGCSWQVLATCNPNTQIAQFSLRSIFVLSNDQPRDSLEKTDHRTAGTAGTAVAGAIWKPQAQPCGDVKNQRWIPLWFHQTWRGEIYPLGLEVVFNVLDHENHWF